MDRFDLYESMAARKSKPKDFQPYSGDNGRVNKCVDLMKSGKLHVGGTLVDVGGGIGDLGYTARDMFDRRIIIDISSNNLKAAEAKGNECYLCDIDSVGMPAIGSETVDTLTALDFIEHIIDPENFARECFRVLKSGGEVFINTPNIRYFEHIAQLWLNGRFPHTSGDREVYHGGHLAFFTLADMNEIFGKVGFKCEKQIKDEECYKQPPQFWLEQFRPKSQAEYQELCLELGCPNLLFKAIKP